MKKIKKKKLNIQIDYNFLMFCNDFIVDILNCADKLNWNSEKIKLKNEDKNKAKLHKYDLFYFREHGYANVINKTLYKHMIFSLVSDYNIYMYDAIECASKQHFGTSFTLLRKPLKDDLLLIEMLYVKGYRFIPKFLKQSVKQFAIDKIKPDEKKKILRKCCKKINFFTGKRLYDRDSKNFKTTL